MSASTAAALCNPWRSPTVQESSDASESLFKGAYVPDADDAFGIPSATDPVSARDVPHL